MNRAKIRSCKTGCGYPALKGRQFCVWHALMRESSDVQAAAANRRLLLTPEESRRARVPAAEWPPGERWCSGCQSFIPSFYLSGSRCRACASSASHARRVEDTYGITAEEYAELLDKQGGRCAICRCVPRSIRLAVDHDHKTGAVRGLLCKRCNHDLLGGGHDDIEVLYRAIEYLIFPTRGRLVGPDAGKAPSAEAVLGTLQEILEHKRVLRAIGVRQRSDPPPF